jgi:hypothetical protein
MSHPAGVDQVLERIQRLFDGRGVFVGHMGVAQLAKVVGGAVGPVQLVQVDVVGLQALQALVHGFEQVGLVEGQAATPDVAGAQRLPCRAGGFGGQHDVLAAACVFQPRADVLLGAALGLGLRGHGVHLGRVHEVDAAVQGEVQLCMGLGFGVLFAPGHGAQGDHADVQAGAAKGAVEHG